MLQQRKRERGRERERETERERERERQREREMLAECTASLLNVIKSYILLNPYN